jgi:hypothetical protein
MINKFKQFNKRGWTLRITKLKEERWDSPAFDLLCAEITSRCKDLNYREMPIIVVSPISAKQLDDRFVRCIRADGFLIKVHPDVQPATFGYWIAYHPRKVQVVTISTRNRNFSQLETSRIVHMIKSKIQSIQKKGLKVTGIHMNTGEHGRLFIQGMRYLDIEMGIGYHLVADDNVPNNEIDLLTE